MKLTGKTALVTGAGTGIGQGIAVELARRGAQVAVHYNRSADGALETKRRIEEAGASCMLVQADVAHKPNIDRMVRETVDRFGTVDILINNAAMQLNYDLFEYDEEQFDRMMAVNLKGYWQCIQAVVPCMKARGQGRIVNISSVHGKRPTDFDPVYAMTKGGIRMLGRESAIELGRYGITVNTVEPGAVDVGKRSSMRSAPPPPANVAKPKSRPRDIRRKFPLGRVGLPGDVAHLVCHIVSDESEFLNGAAIRLDGASMLL